MCTYARETILLTSFLAFLRRLGFLGEAGVQPSSGLAAVTEIQRGSMASGSVQNT